MSWASRRRTLYIGSFIAFVVIVLGFFIFGTVYQKPTCFDDKQNGDEAGVDCGGSCQRVCSFESVDPVVLWSRFFEVAPSTYNAVALIENPNTNAQAYNVNYSLKLRDAENVLVYERKGVVDIPPERILPIFESNIVVGERIPLRSEFSLDKVENWQQVVGERAPVRISDTDLSRVDTEPRLTAVVENISDGIIEDIVLVAILSDDEGNAVAFSQTVLSRLTISQKVPIVFTWRQQFTTEVSFIDIIPKLPLIE